MKTLWLPTAKSHRAVLRRRRGFTLVESLVSLAILVITGIGGVSGFLLLNRYASGNRDRSAVQALCQERIEQILTMPFRPQGSVFPVVAGQDGNQYTPLGTAANYNTTTGAFTGGSGLQTSSEPVTVFKQPDGTALVTGTRTTTVSGTSVTNLVSATVTVTYTIRGQAQSYSLYTLRSSD